MKVTSILHLQTAIYYALLAQIQGCLRTKTVNSEILWALNPSNNVCILIPAKLAYVSIACLQISEAIRRYGISDSTTSLFVIEIGTQVGRRDKVEAIVNGTVAPFSRLSEITDLATIKKVRCMYLCLPLFLTIRTVPQTQQRVGNPADHRRGHSSCRDR